MYRVVQGPAFEFSGLLLIAAFPDDKTEEEVNKIIEDGNYETIGQVRVENGKVEAMFPYNPGSIMNRGIDWLELEKWEKIFAAVREYAEKEGLL